MSLTETQHSIRRVLVLEDNFIIALEAEDILRSLGVESVEIAANTAQARALAEANVFDFALLDVNLGNETSFAFAEMLLEQALPFGFVTGYDESAVFPAHLREIARITKPFNEVSMLTLLTAVPSQA